MHILGEGEAFKVKITDLGEDGKIVGEGDAYFR